MKEPNKPNEVLIGGMDVEMQLAAAPGTEVAWFKLSREVQDGPLSMSKSSFNPSTPFHVDLPATDEDRKRELNFLGLMGVNLDVSKHNEMVQRFFF